MKKQSQMLVIDGGVVKTEEEGVVEGLGIVFGSEEEPDQSRERDFFTPDSYIRAKTSFEVPLYYNHGIGDIKTEIGDAVLTKSDEGWTVLAQINLDLEDGQKAYELVKSTPHGFSTGALSHLVIREAKDNGTHFLKRWVVGEMSVTERPAERKAVVQSVKSLYDGKSEDLIVAIYDEEGSVLWDIEKSDLSFEEYMSGNPEPAKSVDIKYAGGNARYSLWASTDDGDSIDVNVEVYGQLEKVLEEVRRAFETVNTEAQDRLKALVEEAVNERLEIGSDDNKQLTDLRDQLAAGEEKLKAAKEDLAKMQVILGVNEILENVGK